jgi:hypothetical protein
MMERYCHHHFKEGKTEANDRLITVITRDDTERTKNNAHVNSP